MRGRGTSKGQLSTKLPKPRINIILDFTSIIQAFQDSRYVGELKQIWEEIKKMRAAQPSIDSSVVIFY